MIYVVIVATYSSHLNFNMKNFRSASRADAVRIEFETTNCASSFNLQWNCFTRVKSAHL